MWGEMNRDAYYDICLDDLNGVGVAVCVFGFDDRFGTLERYLSYADDEIRCERRTLLLALVLALAA